MSSENQNEISINDLIRIEDKLDQIEQRQEEIMDKLNRLAHNLDKLRFYLAAMEHRT